MQRTTPLPAGPSGKSITLTLPESKWKDGIQSMDKWRHWHNRPVSMAGCPTTTKLYSASDSLESSLSNACHAVTDLVHSSFKTDWSKQLNQPDWYAIAFCQENKEKRILQINSDLIWWWWDSTSMKLTVIMDKKEII